MQIDLAWGLWGRRFEALWQWHKATQENCSLDWDQYAYPLWPKEFGGDTWETGSGALKDAEPRLPCNVARTEQQEQAIRRVLYSKPFRGRQPGEAPLQKLLHFDFDIPEGELT
jgi:hypothetical protein